MTTGRRSQEAGIVDVLIFRQQKGLFIFPDTGSDPIMKKEDL